MELLAAMLAMALSTGAAAVFGTTVTSESHIAAPAAAPAGLPDAIASHRVTTAPGVPFLFNRAIGIPLYAGLAQPPAR